MTPSLLKERIYCEPTSNDSVISGPINWQNTGKHSAQHLRKL